MRAEQLSLSPICCGMRPQVLRDPSSEDILALNAQSAWPAPHDPQSLQDWQVARIVHRRYWWPEESDGTPGGMRDD